MLRMLYILFGILFGITLYKSEVISWFRIQEMFRFQSFHMYGLIFSAVLVAALSMWVIRVAGITTMSGETIKFPTKAYHHGTWLGGTIFGMGWAMTGACPGPLYVHLGAGTTVMIVVITMALIGAWTYGYMRPKLPH